MDEGMTVYIKPGCPWCIEAEDYLRARGYKYEVVNVYADREGYAHMQKISGQSLCPTLTIGDKILADFGEEELEEFLRDHKIEP
jgi:glutaredoxin 3